jgi:hypothetical protein
MEWEVLGWFHLVQDRDQWRVLVNTVKKTLWFHKMFGNF